MVTWASIAEFYRVQTIFWAGIERQWRETKEYCHQKVLEIQTIENSMQQTEYKLNELIAKSRDLLVERFTQEVLAETRYSEPLICPKKVEAWANWKFLLLYSYQLRLFHAYNALGCDLKGIGKGGNTIP